MELASDEQRAVIKEWMSKKSFDEQEKIAAIKAVYDELDICKVCQERINELFAKCDSYIDAVSVPAERKVALKSFVDSLLNRNL